MTSTTTITLRNDFHNTTAAVRIPADGYISRRTVLRIRKALCGMADCTCGGHLDERGPQPVQIAETRDGGARLTPWADAD